MADSFKAIIRELGGATRVSELMGEKVFTVRQWMARENIPSSYWDSLSRLDDVGDRLAFLDRLARLASARAEASTARGSTNAA